MPLIHETHDEADETEANGAESAVEEVAEILLVHRVAVFVEDEEHDAGRNQSVEKETQDFQKDVHSSYIFYLTQSLMKCKEFFVKFLISTHLHSASPK